MNLKLKNEWLNSGIYCPLRKVEIKVLLMEKELYKYYFDNGYSFLFEIELPTKQTVKPTIKESNPTDNDLFN